MLVFSIATSAGMLAANTYSVTQVCPTNVNQLCELHGVNSNGQVVGGVTIAVVDQQVAFVNSNGTATAIARGIGVAINDSGQVAATSGQFFDGVPFSYLYSDGIVTELTPLSGFDATWVTAINDTGQMVGYAASNAAPGTIQAFSYSNGVMTPLGLLPAGTKSWANGINDGGVIVGYGTNALGHLEAFVYRDGAMIGLGTLQGYTDSVATAISDEGDIVGYAIDAASHTQAFLYSGGSMSALGTLPGYNQSRALAINHFGDVVGYAIGDSATDPERAFLYTRGQMYDLNSLIQSGQDTLSRASGINLFGQIVADGHAGSYLLTQMKGQYVPVTP
jgi:probable HAF family extracellular repeat protein